MTAGARKGPKQRIVEITDYGSHRHRRYGLTLACGHEITRVVLTNTVGDMVRCPECEAKR